MKLTIIIPNYNRENFLKKCLHSCLNQSYENYQLIFIDNESSDESLKIANEIQAESSKKFIIDTALNIYPHCWEECVDKAMQYIDGDFFTIVGSDDWIDFDYLKKFHDWLSKQNEEILAVQSSLLWVKNNENINLTNHEYDGINDLKLKLINGCYVNTPTMFYNKKLIDMGLYKTRSDLYSGAADYDFYCKLVDNNIYIHNMNEWIGYFYHVHENQATWSMNKNIINYSKIITKKWKNKWKI
jgi:glycosyltransferase involved in cell wall biosynthesis